MADGSEAAGQDVVVGIGSLPNTEWLAGSGLRVDDGPVCDEHSMAAPGVYAVGDVARWHNPIFGATMRVEHRTNAAEQGLAVARNLLGARSPRCRTSGPTSTTSRSRRTATYADTTKVEVVDGDLDTRRFVAAYRNGDHLVGVVAVKSSAGW